MTTALPRDLFAVTKTAKYFNHAAVGVLPQPTRHALQEFIDAHARAGVLGVFPYERSMPAYRARIGAFVGARPGEIAVLRNTGDGANALSAGYPWEEGDELVLPDDEFPANVQPWLPLRKRGVNIRFVETRKGRMTPDVLRAHITSRTKIVTVSWVSFQDGYRHDLAGLAEVAHAAGALLCVDAIQGLGAFPLDVQDCGIDALYAGGAKWLLALQGVSFLYLRADLLGRIGTASPGWRSTADMWDFLDYAQPYVDDVTRFEGGTPNFIGALSLAESVAVIEEAGTSRICAHVLGLTDRLVERLRRAGAQIASVRSATESSGIVTFSFPDSDPVALGKHLQKEGFVTTYRPTGIRVAPHGYNTAEEIDAFADAIAAYRMEKN
ncbi:MAG TPA: aminotransferase class V-fold PLP-dependent enzyme [Candidatus Rubrimentiphilum sp.]|nr:aminotransferase class V-fold PLP-dependent enzyme [Candidatus Rubrimentiphilum sp.]